jgi:hypothetical protein
MAASSSAAVHEWVSSVGAPTWLSIQALHLAVNFPLPAKSEPARHSLTYCDSLFEKLGRLNGILIDPSQRLGLPRSILSPFAAKDQASAERS